MKEEVTCVEVKCKSTPDWAIGIICALVAVMGLQIFLIVCLMKKTKDSSYSLQNEGSSYSSYSL